MIGKTSTTTTGANRSIFFLYFLCACGVLMVLFYRSFQSEQVFFSNDGPLGVLNSEALAMPSGCKGTWMDLNWLGSNSGNALPGISSGLRTILGPLYFAKFYAPISMLMVGLGAWFLFRQLKLAPLACFLGGLASALNSCFFSTACWGVASQPIGFAACYLALAALSGNTSTWRHWIRVLLAGLAVGISIMEAADIGAIFSLFVAAYVLFRTWVTEATPARRVGLGVARLALVAGFAAFMAAQALDVLTGTAIKGVAGAEQTAEARAARWDWATQWSLPKREALSLVVPGLFGFRMDTPDGGNYWGAAGRDPAWDRYFEGGRQGPAPGGFMRYNGGGIYAGGLVVLIAVWAGLQSLRKAGSVFSPLNRKLIWFWLGVMLVSLLLGFGRHAPFYQFLYALPYFSTIRNPAKFFHVLSWALIIVFAYGVHGLSRRHLEMAATVTASLRDHLHNWWAKVRGFDRKWVIGCLLAIGASLFSLLIYASSRQGLESYLQAVQFDADMAKAIAGFSVRQVGWFVLILVLSVGLVTLVLSGWFAGARAKWGGILLGTLLVADLGRANLPWIIHWDYQQKYATNPVIDRLRTHPYEQRVAIFPLRRFLDVTRLPREAAPLVRLHDQLDGLYGIEWKQHHFLYYNIQCLDIIQEPRLASDKAAFEGALAFMPVRRWELTNTRYLLAPTALLELFNWQIDPVQRRFRIAEQFDIVPKPGIANPSHYEHLTAILNTNGQCALFEFTGALPRAKLYANWQVSTNDPATLQSWVKDLQSRLPSEWGTALAAQNTTDLATLKQLADPSFDPAQAVLLAEPLAATPGTNQNAGEVKFESYAPKHIVLKTIAQTPAVLLLNDKFDPNWKVRVDGKPETLLRANFIMRGVFLDQPGEHRVELRFAPPLTTLYVTLAAIGLGVTLLGLLLVWREKTDPASSPQRSEPRKKPPTPDQP